MLVSKPLKGLAGRYAVASSGNRLAMARLHY